MSRPDASCRPRPLPPEFAGALARAADRLGAFGRHIHWYPEAASTNDLAARLADAGAPEGSIVVAEMQTAGRGRHGRTWCSPPGAGLYVSIVLRPHTPEMPLVTIAAGVALAEGIRSATGLVTHLKWPNDVYVSGRKLAGILAEASSPGGAAPQGCVLGIGINVRRSAYPAEVAARATSLEQELGREVDMSTLLTECLVAIRRRYDDLRSGRFTVVLDAWRASARPLLGQTVEWDGPDGVRRGTAEDVDGSGALLVRTREGTARVIAGEIRWT